MMILLENVHPDIIPVLEKEGILETDLFTHHSDLYVGCKDHAQAIRILNVGNWKGLSSIFKPQNNSDMEKYPWAVDIPFGAMKHDLKNSIK